MPHPPVERKGAETQRTTPHAIAGAATRVVGTRAPQPASAPDPVLGGLLARCGAGDQALHRAAAKLLTQELLGRPLDNASLVFAVRTSGGPYVKPRGIRLRQEAATDLGAFAGPMREWLSTLGLSTERRCGIASIQSESGYWLSVVAAEALADVAPLPLRISPGTRLHFLAHLLVPATEAALVVLGPKGPPRQLPASLAGDRVEASFFLDTPGLHQIQLVVDEAGGPGAAVEAWVGVGDTLPATVDAAPVPGEGLRIDPREPERAIFEMLNAARVSEGLPPLAPDPRLAQLAERHAAAMRSSERLEHDLGDGNPRWRLEAEGVYAAAAGENLARAASLTRAHRAIWASPSHRANLLNPHFDKVGIGVERSASGEWWVCELLADLR
ncbi:MAG TPA: CAP domain-containing protein [Polyangiaceae bacterium]|nr:CAP domain-containing protein [Polyangiaceae bacterium]